MTTGIYVFAEYIKRLQTLFQQNKVNVAFRETVRLTARNLFNTPMQDIGDTIFACAVTLIVRFLNSRKAIVSFKFKASRILLYMLLKT